MQILFWLGDEENWILLKLSISDERNIVVPYGP